MYFDLRDVDLILKENTFVWKISQQNFPSKFASFQWCDVRVQLLKIALEHIFQCVYLDHHNSLGEDSLPSYRVLTSDNTIIWTR